MTKHLMFERSVIIARPIDEVFAHVSDFNRAHTWRTEVAESTTYPDRPVHRGTLVREVARVLRRPIVTETIVDSVTALERLTFSHVSGPLPVSGEYLFADTLLGTIVTYRLVMELRGNWIMFASHLRRDVDRNLVVSLAALRSNLESAVSASLVAA